MNKWFAKEEDKKYIPYGILLLIVLVTEVFLFNFSTWKTLFCEPILLAENVKTDERGVFETAMLPVHENVKNINVNLTIERYDRAKVRVALTDAGDSYAYALPEYEVVPGIKGDGYQNLYPFGEVRDLQVTVTVPEGTAADIASIVINDKRPLDFKVLRVALLYAILSVGYLIVKDGVWMQIPCIRGNRRQLLVIVLAMTALMAVGGFLVRTNPVCVNSPWPHHRQYQELARSLKQGTVVIDEKPEPALLEKENPYDTSALLAEGIPFRMDYALYDGKYYAYFGIVPELLFFLPYHLLTGGDLPNYAAVFAFFCMLVIGVFGTVWEVMQHFGKKVPFVWYLLLSIAVCLMPNYVFMLARPDIYNIPVMGGNAFVFLGTFFWMRAIWTEKQTCLWYAPGSFCMACIAGCRPQMLLYVIGIFAVLMLPPVLKKREQVRFCLKKKEGGQQMSPLPAKENVEKNSSDSEVEGGGCDGMRWQYVLAFWVPILVVAIVVFWYNLARFDSGFNFGATYSLTSNDMNSRGFNFSRVLRGLYSFLFQPPSLHASYPFLESCHLEGSYMGKNIVEFCYGGIFAVCPILLVLFYLPLGGYKKQDKLQNALVGALCLAAFVIATFDINSAGILQRYMGDMIFGFILAAILVLVGMLEGYRENSGYLWIAKLVYPALICGVAFSFLVFITSADGICLEEYNPQLFHRILSYFKF